MDRKLKIVFMGSPEFAVPCLRSLVDSGYNVVGVITAVDKPAGRGRKLSESAVKKYAVETGLKVLQPKNLKNEDFRAELKALNADLNVVVAFRMLPEVVWNMPPLGSINLHASLLPQYRGAAPINWVVINGEKETGLTTFFITHEIDTGKIIFQERIPIGKSETAGELHDRMMEKGAGLILRTVDAINIGEYPQEDQDHSLAGKKAPKIFKEDCRIDWSQDVTKIFNFIRGLSPYPTAWTALDETGVKVFNSKMTKEAHQENFGSISTDGKTFLKVFCKSGTLSITELQIAGKKRMGIGDFLRGNQLSPDSSFF